MYSDAVWFRIKNNNILVNKVQLKDLMEIEYGTNINFPLF